MSEYGRNLLTAVTGLRTTLECAGDSLAAARLDGIVESEIKLAAALAVLPAERGAVDEERDQILHELVRAKSALTRCRRLGQSLQDLVQVSLGAQGLMAGYGADGARQIGCGPNALDARG